MTAGDVADTKRIDDGERTLPKRAAPKLLDFNAMSAAIGTIDYGVINWFNNDFGFGFITPDSDSVNVFVHISQIPGDGTPKIGQRVSYRLAGTPRRPEAQNVQRL
jgi:CspA family cold shock protein